MLPCCHVSSQRYKSTENKDEMIEQMKKEMEEPNGTEEKESWNGKNSDTNEGVVNFEETCQPGESTSTGRIVRFRII